MDEQLSQRLRELEAVEREYNQIKALLDDAAQNHHFDLDSGDIILQVDRATWRIIDANSSSLCFLGFSRAELLGCSINDLETDPPSLVTTYTETSLKTEIYESLYRHHDGHLLRVRVHRRLLGDGLLHYRLEDLSLRQRLLSELSRREDTNYQFREKLKVLNEVNIELGYSESFHDLCRHSVELGISRLGFDRMSLWFLNADQTRMCGTFGVDEAGQVCDEREMSWSFADTLIEQFFNGRREPIVISDEAPLYNSASMIIGTGWHISVPLLNGGQFIGYMGADNFVNRQPMKSYQPELLRLYGATIGHLTARRLEHDKVRKLSNAIQHSQSMIIIFDEQAMIEFVNTSFCHISGYSADEMRGRPLSSLLYETDFQRIWERLAQGHTWKGELTQRRKDGERYEAMVAVSPVRMGDNLTNFVMVQEDITELRQARQREFELRLEQERVRVLEDFVRDVGHEFRTPLAIISTNTYLIQKSADQTANRARFSQIDQQVNYLSQMVDGMIDVVILNSELHLERHPVSLAPLIEDVVRGLQGGRPLHWLLHLQPALTVMADAQRLARAIHEIIKNALQHTPDTGSIIISTRQAEGDRVCISVADTGSGIASDDLDKIFTRFYRADKAHTTRGTGLGLVVARLIVDAHHGQITVHSTPGQGSTFDLWLPLL